MTSEGLKNVDNVKAQMRKGILEYCILSILSRGDSYTPRIISELKAADMIVVEGTLYPLLARQKNQALLSYRWEESPQGPPRKYYMITDRGRAVLADLDRVWEEIVAQVQALRYGGEEQRAAAPQSPDGTAQAPVGAQNTGVDVAPHASEHDEI